MDDSPDSGISEILSQSGLAGPAFDKAAIAEGLAAMRGDLKELDRLLEGREAEYATTFEPEWR